MRRREFINLWLLCVIWLAAFAPSRPAPSHFKSRSLSRIRTYRRRLDLPCNPIASGPLSGDRAARNVRRTDVGDNRSVTSTNHWCKAQCDELNLGGAE